MHLGEGMQWRVTLVSEYNKVEMKSTIDKKS